MSTTSSSLASFHIRLSELFWDAFAKLRHHLYVIGDGPLRGLLARRAGPNIHFTGWISDKDLDGLYEHCAGVIVPNDEDWGMTAIEAMAHGKPVLALRRGGVTGNRARGEHGRIFDDAIPEAIADGLKRLRANAPAYRPEFIKAHASQFGARQFQSRMRALVELPT